MRRRSLLLAAAGIGAAAASGGQAADAPGRAVSPARRPRTGRLPTRIGFGSCARQTKPQPIWDAVLAARPELFIFLGDNVYGDTRDMAVLEAQYRLLAGKPGFQRLCAEVPVLATWDDHDYGEDDAGSDYPMKEASRRVFCDFWNEAPDSLRRTRDGIYDAVLLTDGRHRLQILLPDLRFNRTPINRLPLGAQEYKDWAEQLARMPGREVPGPYQRNPDSGASMLGARQWTWLEQQLQQPADLRILASSLQVVADFPGWEAWINYAEDHERLLQLIRRHRSHGLFCISGDTHYGEISCLRGHVPYPLWDITSSGLTEVWPVTPPNSRRIGEVLREANFGMLHIDWHASGGPSVRCEVRDAAGQVRLAQEIRASDLVTGAG